MTVTQSIDKFVKDIDTCSEAIDQSATSLNQCYNLKFNDTEYVTVRTSVYREALMYKRHIYPETVAFVENLKNFFSDYINIPNSNVLVAMLPCHVNDIKEYQIQVDGLRTSHNFVLGRLDNLHTKIETLHSKYSTQSSKSKTKRDLARAGSAAAMTTGALVGSVSATVVTTTTYSVLGVPLLTAVSVSAPITWPFILAGATIAGLGAGMAVKSETEQDKAVMYEAAFVAIEALWSTVSNLAIIISLSSKLLDDMAKSLSGMDRALGRARDMTIEDAARDVYFRDVKSRVHGLIAACDKFISSKDKLERKLAAIDEYVPHSFEVDWKTQLALCGE